VPGGTGESSAEDARVVVSGENQMVFPLHSTNTGKDPTSTIPQQARAPRMGAEPNREEAEAREPGAQIAAPAGFPR
jgi:hypothetical protein